jgi:ABC-type hemin transport system substrate-binding protein
MTFDGVDAVAFASPDGFVVADRGSAPGVGGAAEPPREVSAIAALAAGNRRRGVTIDPSTVVPDWYGDRLDLDLAVTALIPPGHTDPYGRS